MSVPPRSPAPTHGPSAHAGDPPAGRPARRARTPAVACLLIAALAAGPGCLYRQSVKYSLKDVKPVVSSPFAGRSLAVKEFEDTRPAQDSRSFWSKVFGKPAPQEFRDGKDWLYNGNENYKDKRAAPWVTRMVVKHLAKTKIFKAVELSGKDPPGDDLLLEGKIKDFWGGKEPSDSADAIEMTSMQFGAIGVLLGALMITRVKTEYRGKTVLIDLKLSEVGTGTILWQGTVEGQVSGKSMADTDGLTAYDHANDALKEATKSLVEKIQASGSPEAGAAKAPSPDLAGPKQPGEPPAPKRSVPSEPLEPGVSSPSGGP